MRKVLTATGIVLVVLAVLAGGAWYLIDREARAALDRVFAQLERSGATASYEAFHLDLLTQSVEITGIRYERDGPTPTRIAVARIAAEGLPLSMEIVGATRIRIEGVDGEIDDTTLHAGLIDARNVSAPVAALRAPSREQLDALLGAVVAEKVALPDLTLTLKAGRDTRETVIRDIAVTALENGRIDEARMSGTSERLLNRAGQTVHSAEYGEGRIEGIHLAALVRTALSRTGSDVAAARVFDRITHADGRITGADGVRLNFGQLTVTEVDFKAGPTPLPEMASIFAVAGRIRTAGAQRIVAETAAELFERIQFARFEAADLSLEARGAPEAVKIERFEIAGLSGARLERVTLSGIEIGPTPDSAPPRPPVLRGLSAALETAGIATTGVSAGSVKIEMLSIRDLSLARLATALGLLVEKITLDEDPAPALLARIVPEAASISLSRAEATLNTGARASLASLDLTLAPDSNGLPKAVAAKMAGLVIPIDPAAGQGSAELAARGFTALEFGFVADAAEREEATGVEIRELTLSAGQLGALTLRAAVDGLQPELVFEDEIAVRAALEASSLQKLEFTFANRGAVERIIAFLAEANGTTPDEARLTLPETVKVIIEQTGAEQLAIDVSEAVRKFVLDPRSLTFRLTSPRRVSVQELADAVRASPISLFSLLNVSVGVNE